jgi:hypothetical protein
MEASVINGVNAASTAVEETLTAVVSEKCSFRLCKVWGAEKIRLSVLLVAVPSSSIPCVIKDSCSKNFL